MVKSIYSYFSDKQFLRLLIVFCFDGLAAYVSFIFAFWLRLGGVSLTEYFPIFTSSGIVFAILAAVVYRILGVSKAIWRYTSIPDLILIVLASTLAICMWVIGEFTITRLTSIPRTVPFILWFVMITLLGGSRFLYRYWREKKLFRNNQNQKNTLIIGSDHEAMMVIRNLYQLGQYKSVGILNDKSTQIGRSISGVPVLNSFHNIEIAFNELPISQKPQLILLTKALAYWPNSFRKQLINLARDKKLEIAVLPAISSQALNLQPQQIDIEQILGRENLDLAQNDVSALFHNKRVLITGAGGSIGTELTQQIANWQPSAICLVESSEFNLYTIDMALQETSPNVARKTVLCDVRNAHHVLDIWRDFKPEIVFHAAALKHVPLVEINPREGLLTNVQGSINVAEATRAVNAKAFIQISTDKAVNPTNIMGASKRLAEFYAQGLDMQAEANNNTRFVTVRFGNVIGSSGSVIPLFQKQIDRGGPVTVTHTEIKRYFMSISEAVSLILRAAVFALDKPEIRGRVLVLNMGEPKKIIDIAQDLIVQAGLTPHKDIAIEVTGLRAGEKLHEELFDASETRVETDDPALLAAEVQLSNFDLQRKKIQNVLKVAETNDLVKIQLSISEILENFPNYYGVPPTDK